MCRLPPMNEMHPAELGNAGCISVPFLRNKAHRFSGDFSDVADGTCAGSV